MRVGLANLPLHYGAAPSWLFDRMKKLSREIVLAMLEEFGQEEVLRRLADPYWFQSFGCLLGFDWHSSGVTTTVCGALKEGLRGLEKDTGIFIVGGKGRTSRKAPEEIIRYGDKYGIAQTERLIYLSKMSAKIDNSALQDGFSLYHHTFIFTSKGEWVTIQQGMNLNIRMARRYHWLSDRIVSLVNEPHTAICCDQKTTTLNLVAEKSKKTREIATKLVQDNFQELTKNLRKIKEKKLNLPAHHPIYSFDFNQKKLEERLVKIKERIPQNFEELLAIEGVGPKTVRALALIAEVIYGAKPSYEDPVRYSFAHGGKDGYPYPVNKRQYDQSINILSKAIRRAKIGQRERINLLKKLAFSS